MPVSLYMDVHVPVAITEQLRRRGVEVLTSIEEQTNELEDAELLERARNLGRIIFTQDLRFRVLAEGWQSQGKPFAGLLYGPQGQGLIGAYVNDLEIIAKASDLSDWENTVAYLPWK